MELDRDTILSLAKEIDPVNFNRLTDLFLEMVELEHSSRHKSRPGITKKLAELIDEERRQS